jgi:hypothetical protein
MEEEPMKNQLSLRNENLYRVPQVSVQQPAISALQRYSAILQQYLFLFFPGTKNHYPR